MARVTTKQAVAARKSWQERAETWREKIRVSNIIDRLGKHAEGQVEMTATQIKAAQVLLDRVMPTLSASDHTTRKETPDPKAILDRLKELGVLTPEGMTKIEEDYQPNKELH